MPPLKRADLTVDPFTRTPDLSPRKGSTRHRRSARSRRLRLGGLVLLGDLDDGFKVSRCVDGHLAEHLAI